jgi:ADP-ribose pyrophosphatase YjhB (NUDIX family)
VKDKTILGAFTRQAWQPVGKHISLKRTMVSGQLQARPEWNGLVRDETRHGYFLPGGGIDLGERKLDALKREIMEETGYQVSELEEIGEAIEEDHRLVWLARGDAIRLLLRQGQVWAVQRIAAVQQESLVL